MTLSPARKYDVMAVTDDDLIDLIAEEALIERDLLTREATLADVGLDSVGVVSVIFAVEEKYGVEISEDAFVDTANLGQFLDALKAIIAKAL
jgi:acyl carrier protein